MNINGMTEVVVLKVTPCHTGGLPHKQIVNIYTFQEDHFGLQAIKIKQLFNQYKANICVVDGNGLNLAHVKSLELLGTPNGRDEGNQQRSFFYHRNYMFFVIKKNVQRLVFRHVHYKRLVMEAGD